MVSVGVIANPASGRDIRRLVTGASVFDNAEKGSMVHRLLAGLGAVGVEKVWMMPAGEGLSGSLLRRRHGTERRAPSGHAPASLEFLDIPMRGDADDSTRAAQALVEAGVAAVVVLGGDGTNRAVAKAIDDVPLCALSTGTNNAFPRLLEATVAGLATGLVATGRIRGEPYVRRCKRLDVTVGARRDLALVDFATSRDRFVGARALWRVEDLGHVVVTFAEPAAVGLSAVAGHVRPVARDDAHGLSLRLVPAEDADEVLTVALGPGMITRVGVGDVRTVALGETVAIAPDDGCLALDGERELERTDADDVSVTLAWGPRVIDVDAVMANAAAHHLMRAPPP